MTRPFFAAAALLAASAMPGLAQSIEGNWQTESGSTATIQPCGGSYCITLTSGPHAGRQIGTMSGGDGSYSGSITDPTNDRTYRGKAAVSGGTMELSGCVLGGLICRGETWSKR